MIDGEVRRGADAFKAIALGASMVFMGGPFTYAVAVGGEVGVTHAIRLMSHATVRAVAGW
ncbi:L-lactate dehydrogenase [Burkholderia singularis]|uniref:L-lactate dehydrogenase n=2 Tax=Burkholderia singularis TaxID=1503053 RepID=A0A238GYQ9_9BURK|nr:L-lactate dehydrogenase [Burkholderia singularis]